MTNSNFLITLILFLECPCSVVLSDSWQVETVLCRRVLLLGFHGFLDILDSVHEHLFHFPQGILVPVCAALLFPCRRLHQGHRWTLALVERPTRGDLRPQGYLH